MKNLYLLLLCVSFLVNNAFAQEKEQESEKAYLTAEQMPYLISCENSENKRQCTNNGIEKFIMNFTVYPQNCIDEEIQGKVYVQYEVNTLGKIQNVKLIKGVHFELDNEAVRVIKNLPHFSPGVQDGKKVVIKSTIPVNFMIG